MEKKNNDIIKYDKNRLLEAILRHLSFQDYENTPESTKINLNVSCTRYNDTKHGAYVRFPQEEDDFKILSDISLKLTTNVPILDNIPIKDTNIEMKKYIRTKDGIYEVKHKKILPVGDDIFFTTIDNQHFYSYDIINQADTIEELCDEFVVVSSASVLKPWRITRKWLKTLEQAQKYEPSNKCSIYGAIWTDKGLIYVAKMNEKGELELI